MNIGTRIAELRKEMGITQLELSEKLSVSRSCVANWERGARAIDAVVLYNLCLVFDVSADYLCSRTDLRSTRVVPPVYNMDFYQLNFLGRRMMYEYYEFLMSKDIYKINENNENLDL